MECYHFGHSTRNGRAGQGVFFLHWSQRSYDETDIDGESRIYYGRVDIGGDEYHWSPADFDEDGTVNLIDMG